MRLAGGQARSYLDQARVLPADADLARLEAFVGADEHDGLALDRLQRGFRQRRPRPVSASSGISAVTNDPGRHLRAGLATEATTRAARVSLSSSGLTNMMVAGRTLRRRRPRW